ncbi:inositol monophosphatase family protein [Balneatrix alpica]|uniref:Inositol-1-monophosphatase n=1 Tax=Balneatrix alpica TaxID=75684 RepID=A0ABV5ZB81_9GAMM|nr:inositol monophosphatase family protein [Balneatrix alpica]
MNRQALNPLAAYAQSLARQAGTLLVQERQQASFSLELKRGIELVTSADIKADACIRQGIEACYPDHLILSEESSPHLSPQQLKQGPVWIIDPIDGTVNFANGQPAVAVSIAFAWNGEVQVGVVHCPFLQETFSAVRGQGAYLNGLPLQVQPPLSVASALVATGFPYERAPRAALLARLSRVMAEVQDVRRLGSAAIDLCYVAAGRLAGYFETVKPWDMAAGALIVHEAGGVIGRSGALTSGLPAELDGEHLVAASPAFLPQLLELLGEPEH